MEFTLTPVLCLHFGYCGKSGGWGSQNFNIVQLPRLRNTHHTRGRDTTHIGQKSKRQSIALISFCHARTLRGHANQITYIVIHRTPHQSEPMHEIVPTIPMRRMRILVRSRLLKYFIRIWHEKNQTRMSPDGNHYQKHQTLVCIQNFFPIPDIQCREIEARGRVLFEL